jgi:hypothetical protein
VGFEHGTLRLTCNVATDAIVVVACERLDPSEEIVDDDSLLDLLGKSSSRRGRWSMTVAIRMPSSSGASNLTTRSESCRQFEAAASAITVAHVSV